MGGAEDPEIQREVSPQGIQTCTMKISSFLLTIAAHASLATLTALAHPGSGIVVDQQGNVYFTYTGRGAARIDAQGKLTYLHKDTGGHFIALDAEGSFSSAAGN